MVVVIGFAGRWTYCGESRIGPRVVPRQFESPGLTRQRLQRDHLWGNYIGAKLPPGSTNGAVPAGHRADGVAGPLGRGVQASFAIRNFTTLRVYITPFLGGFVADCYLCRTRQFSTSLCFVYPSGSHKADTVLLGVCLIIFVGTSVPSSLVRPNGAFVGLIVAIIVIGMGAGSIEANVPPMIAEQYTGKLRKKTLPTGEVVLISPSLTYQRVFMCKYLDPRLSWCNSFES